MTMLSTKNRMKYIWDPFAEKGTSAHTKEAEENIRISGTVKVSFDAAIDRETAILSAMLVDLGTQNVLPQKKSNIQTEHIVFKNQ